MEDENPRAETEQRDVNKGMVRTISGKETVNGFKKLGSVLSYFLIIGHFSKE